MMVNMGRYSAKRNLCRWKGTNKLERAMISLILIAIREGKELGWDEAARCTDDDASGEAFKQMLMKRKAEYLDAGYPVPARCAGRKVKVERDPYAASEIARASQNTGFVGVNASSGSPVTLKKKRQVRARNAVKPISFGAPLVKTQVKDFNAPMTLRARAADAAYAGHGFAAADQEEDTYAEYPVGVGAPESDSDDDYIDPEDRPKLQSRNAGNFNGVVSLKVPYTFKQGKTITDNDDFEVLRPVQPMTAQNTGNIQNTYSHSNDSMNTMGFNGYNTQALDNFGFHNGAMNTGSLMMNGNGSGYFNMGMDGMNNSFTAPGNINGFDGSSDSFTSSQNYFDDAMDSFGTGINPTIPPQLEGMPSLGMGGEVKVGAFGAMNSGQDMWSAAPVATHLPTTVQGPPTHPYLVNTPSSDNIDMMPSAFPHIGAWQNLLPHQVQQPDFSMANAVVNSIETKPFDGADPVWDGTAVHDEFGDDNKVFD